MTTDRRPLPAVFLLVIAFAVFPPQVWWFAVRPRLDARLEVVERELTQLDRDKEMALAAERKYKQFHEEVARLGGERAKLSSIAPDETFALTDQRALFDSAREHGITLSMTPRIADQQTLSAERRYDLIASGALAPLTAWLGDLEQRPRLFAMPSIELTPDGKVWRANAIFVIAYDRGDADSSATTSSARTGRAK